MHCGGLCADILDLRSVWPGSRSIGVGRLDGADPFAIPRALAGKVRLSTAAARFRQRPDPTVLGCPESSRAWFSGSPLLSSIPTVYATPGECAPGNSRSCRTREGRPRHDVRSGRDRRHLCRDRLRLCLELPKHLTSGQLRQLPPRPKQTQSCASQCSHHLLGDALMHPSLYA